MSRVRPPQAEAGTREETRDSAATSADPDLLPGRPRGSLSPGQFASGAAAAVAFAAVAAVAVRQGGYFPSSWGWVSLAMLWVAGLSLLLRRRISVGPLEGLFLASLVTLLAWTAVSAAWSVSLPQSLLDAERTLVYVAACGAILLLCGRETMPLLLGGALAAVVAVCTYSLATWLFPLRLGVDVSFAPDRLAEPIGYWNALGIFAAMGLALALAFAAHGRLAVRAAAGASLVVLATTVYFTFGRGPWFALAFGLLAAVVVSPHRLKLILTLLVVAPPAAAAVLLASGAEGLTHRDATAAEAAADGRGLALAVLLLAAAAATLATALGLAERRVGVGPWARRTFGAALLVAVLAACGAVFAQYGGPGTIAERAYHAFDAPVSPGSEDLGERLFDLSGNGRADLWRIAWDSYRDHGWRGSGAGTYEYYFLANRPPVVLKVRDAHSLYFEVLSELGPVGLGALLLALGLPLAAAIAARRRPLVAGALGAYVAFLAHAAVDWDWEIPAVTLVALICGCAMLIAARGGRSVRLPVPVRVGGVVAVAALALVASVALLGHAAVSRSVAHTKEGELRSAVREARLAARLAPWSPDPWAALGEARLQLGDAPGAREAFGEATERDPGNWRFWVALARAEEGEGRARALERAAQLNPHGGEIVEARRVLLGANGEGADG